METTEIIFGVFASIGSLATAISLIVLLCSLKGTKKQINSLSKMAESYTKIYQIERIKAGKSISPDMLIAFKNENWFQGVKLMVKCRNYDITVKGIKIKEDSSYEECLINDPLSYIPIAKNETKVIPLKYYLRNYVYPCMPKVTLIITTSLDETYEMTCECTNINSIYSLNGQQIDFKAPEYNKRMVRFSNKSFSVSGAFSRKLDECFPEINKTDLL